MKQKSFGAVLFGLVAVSVTMVGAQMKPADTKAAMAPKASMAAMSLGSVNISRNVTADGKPLAAGTYTLRVSDDKVAAVVGQTADESRWVEFLQGTTVKGREMATVLTKDALKSMTREDKSAAPGSAKVEMLKGNDYMRVWVNHMGVQYLIHLSVTK